MQAPTTPSGGPTQEPDERSCPTCGAANGLTAAFCWRCYQPFGLGSAPPGLAGAPRAPIGSAPLATPTGWAPPATPNAPTYRSPRGPQAWEPAPGPFDVPKPKPSRNVGSMLAIAVMTAAIVGGVSWFFTRGGPVTVPESFGGLTHIEDAQTELISETFRAQVDTAGIEGDMAMYGAGAPTAALIWIKDASVPTTDAAFDEFATGFDAGIGSDGSLNVSKKTRVSVDGVTYVCAPVVSVAPGTICMWQDEDVFWLLFDFSGAKLDAGQDLAVTAHDAVEAA